MTRKLKPVRQQQNQLMETIKCDNPVAVQLLIEQATKIAYKHHIFDTELNQKNYATMQALILSLNPQDTTEVMLAAQYVALHTKAMKVIAEDNYHIMGKALMMLRLSQQALSMLQSYRGKSQTINVNYNVLNQGNAILNAQFQAGGQVRNQEGAHGVQNGF